MRAPENPPLLGSWKEIAAFFGRDVRTVQRWEHEGLPVHRRPGAGRSGVFADPSELEAWLRGRPETEGDTAPPEPASHERDAREDPLPRPSGGRRLAARFLLAAAAVLAAGVPLSWLAAGQAGRHESGPAFAETRDAIGLPRWGNVDGNSRHDLIVSLPSAVLVLLDAGAKPCRGDVRDCADVRITAGPDCFVHSSQISDLNGDGIDDLAVSCLLAEPASHIATGPAYLVWGRTSWPGRIELPRDAAVTIQVTARHDDRLETCLSPQGPPDLNGDGIADLLLGAVEAPYRDRGSAGTLFVFFGRRDWTPAVDVRQADIAIHGSRTGEGLGYPCATGDFTGDGRQDVAMGAYEDRIWNLLGGAGRVYLVENPGEWPAVIDLATHGAMRVEGRHRNLPRRQLRLVDLDGDAKGELILSEPIRRDDPSYRGRIGIWRGGPLKSVTTSIDGADIQIEGTAGGHLGTSMDVADFDGDGSNELIVAESARGALLAVSPFKTGARKLDASGATLLATFSPMGVDDGVESLLAIDGQRIAHVARARGGRWQIRLDEPFEPMQIDVRPYFADDVVLKPGIAVVAIPRGATRAEPLPDTVRANGARPFAVAQEDINRDGTPDWMVYFQTADMTLAGEPPTLVVTARDRAGRYLRGTSPVRVVVVTAGR